jgi:hypothetical protein
MVNLQTGLSGVTAVGVVVLVFRREQDLVQILHHKGKEGTAQKILLRPDLVTPT